MEGNNMPYCYNCGSPIAGNFCQKCGWDATQVPGQLPQQRQQYQQLKPRYPSSLRKSRAPHIMGLIVIQAILLLASISFSRIVPDEEDEIIEMTLMEFMEDYEDSDGDGIIDNLRSLDLEDKVRISDVVAKTHFINWGHYTLIICESVMDLEWSFPIFLPWRAENIEEGDPIMVVWHISQFNIKGIIMELPEELNRYYIFQEEIFVNTTNPKGKLDNITLPVGELDFTETTSGNFTGGVVSQNYEFRLYDCSITIIDASDGSTASIGPPVPSGYPISTSGGLRLKYTDTNRDGKVNIGDWWNISNGANNDQIKLLHYVGDIIMMYTIP